MEENRFKQCDAEIWERKPSAAGRGKLIDPVLTKGKRGIGENRQGTCAWGGV